MKEVKAIIQPFMLTQVLEAVREIPGSPGITISHLQGLGGMQADERDDLFEPAPRAKLEMTEAIGRDVWVPRRLAGKGFNYDQFEVRLPVTAPEGGTVRLVCHAGSRDVHLATYITQN